MRSKARPGRFESIQGMELLDKVINIDQSPIGRTPRSNPATYTGVFDLIRQLFADTQEDVYKRQYMDNILNIITYLTGIPSI